jgi:hypothetical protein
MAQAGNYVATSAEALTPILNILTLNKMTALVFYNLTALFRNFSDLDCYLSSNFVMWPLPVNYRLKESV